METYLIEMFQRAGPIWAALIATLFTWFLTAAGAAPVFVVKRVNRRVLDGMLGLAAGVMIAASFWSLLAPAIDMSGGDWKPAAIGFVAGGAFLYLVDKTLPHLHVGLDVSQAEGVKTSWQRSILLVLAVTMHNVPEGLAVGVAFGAVQHAADAAQARGLMLGGIALAIGIGLQNFPEGLAVAVPLRREGFSRWLQDREVLALEIAARAGLERTLHYVDRQNLNLWPLGNPVLEDWTLGGRTED